MQEKRKPYEPSVEEMVSGILEGNRRMLSRAITLVESTKPEHESKAHEILDRCLAVKKETIRIGITGSPGAGKSTFIEALGKEITGEGLRLAVLAVDPSSSRSGGSILGDKARMERLAANPDAFIRPTASSGHLGGTSPKTHEAILLCEAAGFDVVIVETVGVGQSEITADSMVDFILLLMLPGSGDELQGIKRGIMEVADAIAVTKSDGAQEPLAMVSKADFQAALRMLPQKQQFHQPKVFLTSAVTGRGIADVWVEIRETLAAMRSGNILQKRRKEQLKQLLYTSIETILKAKFFNDDTVRGMLPGIEQQVLSETISPFSGAKTLLEAFCRKQ
ncbi:MAG: methylmalonyl Co-A mutase-associated GTPase MeaB [Chlorobium sp.]|uniref:methylmalonyl Co-A mutase-associated GTPase MeaB n=1 Tax=Chlorobium sp. TaxID=1095 RepID=UPI0025BF91AC|nr:methylmalonyl Co-A mutase-associated GTPase MeaB [Chlorobium sp.]MCF8216897.1 methylmalonyl Co-A mutase-associated GTPase MeaB [Chlorobium sp.]MCF8271737.1 methylmalonyl Co-A mutase-associated GTPase MeaB [Chlorobium sp.]MCF8288125.1 methylmalonyl Co-A mutase-associated GTPase MeaB [Chlorobium sp.]MCF8291716.1 methylmalonyl Co-A mutase-associated GTPase MeaB [Chlorobium sp.]MCF8385797.1 methylmalonyl Co-A mutase-associated GTPase MeaB [Chlorobium sp.]